MTRFFLTRPFLLRHGIGLLLVALGVVLSFLTPLPVGSPEPYWKSAAHLISTKIHDGYLIAGILLLLGLAWRERCRASAIRVLAVMGTETALFGVIKAGTWYGLRQWPRPSGTDGGFPSGHTAASVALAYLLSERFPALAPVFYALAATVAWSRVGDGAHYPYQVLAGAILGFGVALVLSPRFVPSSNATSADIVRE
ncbi:MAG: phosphatase PAP2 family protein [Capsulimonadales bacterium]|nr:phosphatase PAP2 family protein [Capsulimonadales bacterium]